MGIDKKKILIVDDEEDFTCLVKLNLEATGRYEVMTEKFGREGVASARRFKPDLMLLDIIMPDMEGTEVARRLRADKETKDIPIVFITAAITKEEAKSKGGIPGGHPYIAKPVGLDELITCIEKYS